MVWGIEQLKKTQVIIIKNNLRDVSIVSDIAFHKVKIHLDYPK